MDQYLTITLWMVVLLGCVGGTPVLNSPILRLGTVQCDANVTFTSPAHIEDHCYAAALSTIQEELMAAKQNCTPATRINNALKTLRLLTNHSALTNYSDCSWNNEPRKQFKDFAEDIRVVVNKLRSFQARNAPQ